MYLVNSRREASLLIPESQPVAVSSVAQRLQDQVTPSLFALWERAKSAVVVLPEEPPAQEMPEGEAAIVSEMQQVPLEQEPPSDPSVINGVIAKGDSASELLSPYMSASSVQQLLNVTRKLHPLNNLRTGQPYTLVCSPDGRDMERFEYEINDRKKLIVTKTDEGLVAHVEPIVYDFSLVRVSGTIRSSLFETLASTGESPILAVRIADIFGSEINFIKDLREGDSFSLLIEKRFRENEFKGYGKVLGATFTNQGKTYEAYNFATEDGEAFFNDKMGRVIDELKAKNLLTVSDGAFIVDLDEEKTGMPPCLILKKDGATLYATRDIAAALWRKDEYDFDKCLYVVAYQQDLHFRQWFKVVEKMGYEWAKDLVHVAFGMISYEGQSLSTRKGHVVFLEDLLLNAIQKARAIIEEKSPDLDNKDEVARQVGIGAVIYADLQNNRIKDIDFSWERALSFDGETGPYVQYTHARCCSALRKAEGLDPAEPDYSALSDDYAQELLRLLSRFPETVRDAAARYEPSIVTRAVTELCKAYNKFYYENRILEENAGVREARVRLTRAVRDTVRTGLWLIGMEAPERM